MKHHPPYTVIHGYDDSFGDGDYEYYGVFDNKGYPVAMYYAEDTPIDAEAEANDLCNRINGKEQK